MLDRRSFLSTGTLGVLASGYVAGPIAARILASQAMRTIDANLAELPDSDNPTEGATP